MITIRFFWRGEKNNKLYDIVIIQKYRSRKSIFLEKIGSFFGNKKNIKILLLNKKRLQYWLVNGAIPSKSVYHFIRKFKILI
jgi:ribosomal protein S16